MSGNQRPPMRVAWIGLALVAALYALARLRAVPPDVVPASAPAREFSAERALETLRWIEGDGRPHPLGSTELARVRVGLVERFRALGLGVEVQDAIGTDGRQVGDSSPTIGRVHNVVATLAGRERGRALLLCAHSDSVGAGPGTSDDGAGVAALVEIARALASEDPPRHDVMFLVNEGEEAGLLGATAFVASHPRARDVAVVVNLEARGTEGRAHLFETSTGNADLIATVAPALATPSTTSLAYEVYRALPNDTDLTVFKVAGYAGVNFAYVGGVSRYHTPIDDVAHLDPRSLQHLGGNALAAVRALDARLPEPPTPVGALGQGNAAWTDVYGAFVVRTLAPVSFAIGALACAWMFVCARRERARDLARGAAAALAGLVAATASAQAITWIVVRAQGVRAPWSVTPGPLRLAVLVGALGVGVAVTRAIAARHAHGALATWRAVHLCVAVAGVVAAIFVPGAAFVLVVPACAAALVAPRASSSARDDAALRAAPNAIAQILPVLAAAVVLGPALVGVEEGLGFQLGAALGALVGVVAIALAPIFVAARASDRRTGRFTLAALGLVAAVATVVAARVPPHDADAPRPLRFAHVHDAPTGAARWFASTGGDPLPPAVAAAGAFGGEQASPVSWWRRYAPTFVAPAEPTRAAPPRLDVLRTTQVVPTSRDDGERTPLRVVRARLSSPRGGRVLVVRLPGTARLESVAAGGIERRDGFARRGVLAFVGFGAEGATLEIALSSEAPVEIDLLDVASEPGPGFERLDGARGPDLVPYGEGDVSLILERVRL